MLYFPKLKPQTKNPTLTPNCPTPHYPQPNPPKPQTPSTPNHKFENVAHFNNFPFVLCNYLHKIPSAIYTMLTLTPLYTPHVYYLILVYTMSLNITHAITPYSKSY